MTYQYYCPDGRLIIGTADLIPGTAFVQGWEKEDDGTLSPIWDGETKVHWDGQTTTQRDGKDIYVCEAWDEHLVDECELRDDDTEDADNESDDA